MPILTVPDITGSGIKSGDVVTTDLVNGTLKATGGEIAGEPFSQVQIDIYEAGNLFEYGKTKS
jgi:hypothetical protein